jgi:ABC-type transport system involved in multi-copper enzyme maturation permease subunit
MTLSQTRRIVGAIGRVTFLEIIRDKVLYNIVLCSAVLFIVAMFASQLATFKQDRAVLDLGIATLALSCMAIAILTGSSLIGREYERRTVLVTLSRPVSRLHFVIGKFVGLSGVLLVNWGLLAVVLTSAILVVSGGKSEYISWAYFGALLFAWVASEVAAAFAVFFSAFTTTSLAVVLTVGFWMVGTNVSQLRWLSAKVGNGGFSALLNMCAYLFPNFEHFSLGFKVTYALPVSLGFIFFGLFYALCWISGLLAFASVVIRGRE